MREENHGQGEKRAYYNDNIGTIVVVMEPAQVYVRIYVYKI